MKLIIAGSRDLDLSTDFINALLDHYVDFTTLTEVVSGGATGVDNSGERWVHRMQELCGHLSPKLKVFEADWARLGKVAGPIRNQEMAQYADALLLVWDGESRGSANMKHEMISLGKPVYEVILSRTKG